MVARPNTFISWTDGASGKVTQPPSAVCLQGFTAGQAPPYQYFNWLMYQLDQWVQYLDGRAGGSGAGGQSSTNLRLLNGGNWSVQGTTLQWDAAFSIAVPGQTDANNTASTAGVTVPDGSVAYVQLNTPFTYTATTTSGSTALTNLSSTAGLSTGMTVTGAGIPASTTITVSGGTVTLSNAATATGNGVSVTFQSSGALTVYVAAESSLSAGPQTTIFARNNGGQFIVGVGAGEMLPRNGEAKTLRGNGFGATLTGTAGFAITQGQICYVSPGGTADQNRTAGSIFTADASTAAMYGTNATTCRSRAVGVATQSVAAGQQVTLLMQGVIGGFSGLTVGGLVWLNPSAAGGITQVMPGSNPGALTNNTNIAANAIVLIGVAVSSTQVYARLPSPDTGIPNNATFTSVQAATMVVTNLVCSVSFSSPSGHRFLSQSGYFDSTVNGPWAGGGTYATYMAGGMQWFLQPQVTGKLELLRIIQKCTGYSSNAQVTWKLYSYPAGSSLNGTGTLVGAGQVTTGVPNGGSNYPSISVPNPGALTLLAGTLYSIYISTLSGSVPSGSNYAIAFTAQIVE